METAYLISELVDGMPELRGTIGYTFDFEAAVAVLNEAVENEECNGVVFGPLENEGNCHTRRDEGGGSWVFKIEKIARLA